MKVVRRLISEIHRRSVWQVLAVYVAGSWLTLQAVDLIVETAALPAWVRPLALVLLLIGLPIVLATAIVQEGAPEAGRARESDRSASVASDPTAGPAAASMSATEQPAAASVTSSDKTPDPPSAAKPDGPRLRRLFTWRNAILGGASAFALLGLAITAYVVMWATGIGPAGNLTAQGVIDSDDRVILADFNNRTTDAELGTVLTEALRIDLDQSDVLNLLPDAYLADILARMARDPDASLTADAALEAAVREGIKAVIAGEVGSVGNGFVLTARIVEPGTGASLASFRETAESADHLLSALDALSQKIRRKAGESLGSIHASGSLEAVTTPSLSALRKYTQAIALDEQRAELQAIAVLEEAVREDTAFAMAFRKLAVITGNRGDPASRRTYAARAARLADRLTEIERHLANAFHYQFPDSGTIDSDRVIQEYEAVLRIDPDNGSALNNLSVEFRRLGRTEDAIELLERAINGPGEVRVSYDNLILGYLDLADAESAARVLDRFEQRFSADEATLVSQERVGLNQSDSARVHAAARQIQTTETMTLGTRRSAATYMGYVDLRRGKLREAAAHWADAAQEFPLFGVEDPFALAIQARAMVMIDPELAFSLVERAHSANLALNRARADSLEAEGIDASGPTTAQLEATAARWMDDLTLFWRPILDAATIQSIADRVQRYGTPSGPPTFAVTMATALRGDTAAATAMLEEVLDMIDEQLREITRCPLCYSPRRDKADILAALGRWDEAMPILVDLLERPGDYYAAAAVTPLMHLRLARAYEAAGDTASATIHYARFAEMWQDADPELQTFVQDATARAARGVNR